MQVRGGEGETSELHIWASNYIFSAWGLRFGVLQVHVMCCFRKPSAAAQTVRRLYGDRGFSSLCTAFAVRYNLAKGCKMLSSMQYVTEAERWFFGPRSSDPKP